MPSPSETNPLNCPEQERRDRWDATTEQRERIRRGYSSYYEKAFTAFLTLPDTQLENPRLLAEFEARHVGSFATIEDACYEYLRNIGWIAAADKYLVATPSEIPPTFWDYDSITRQLDRMYHLIKIDGEIHAFTRRT